MNGALPRGAAWVFQMGRELLAEQHRRIDSLDTKLGIILAVDGVLTGLLFSSDSDLLALGWKSGIAVVGLLASFGIALVGLATRKYRSAPSFTALVPMMDRDAIWLQWRFLGNLQEALVTNSKKLDEKAVLLNLAIWSLALPLVVFGAYLIGSSVP